MRRINARLNPTNRLLEVALQATSNQIKYYANIAGLLRMFRNKKCFPRPTNQSYHEQLKPLVMRLYTKQIVMIGQETTTVQTHDSRRKMKTRNDEPLALATSGSKPSKTMCYIPTS
jgi:hypothetical protein